MTMGLWTSLSKIHWCSAENSIKQAGVAEQVSVTTQLWRVQALSKSEHEQTGQEHSKNSLSMRTPVLIKQSKGP